jgi:hypothetical protein
VARAGVCTEADIKYILEWRATAKMETNGVQASTKPFPAKLAEFMRGQSEGRVHTHATAQPARGLKQWYPDRIHDFADGVDFLIAADELFQKIREISRGLDVARVYERGPDGIVRDVVATDLRTRQAGRNSSVRPTTSRPEARRCGASSACSLPIHPH